MKGEFDTFMTTEDYEKLPDPQPIAALCKQLGLDPPNVMVRRKTSGSEAFTSDMNSLSTIV